MLLGTFIAVSANSVQYDPDSLAKKIVAEQHKLEMQLYAKMPDVINCKQQHWMKDCDFVNFLLKKHPGAPIRVMTADGVTQSFAPDTPPSMLNALLDPNSKRAAKAFIQYQKSVDEMNSSFGATLSEMFIKDRFKLEMGDTPEPATPFDNADHSNFLLSVIVSKGVNGTSGFLDIVEALNHKHPRLKTQVIVLNSDLSWFNKNVKNRDFTKSNLASSAVVHKLKISSFPTTFFKDLTSNRTARYNGELTANELNQWLNAFISTNSDEDE